MSKSFKKKKYNARFPPARIKKIMQTDEEVGKVAAAVPVIISRALEMFIESLVTETSKLTIAKKAKTMSTAHIKQTIKNTKQFDFLLSVVKDVPDQLEDYGNGEATSEVAGSTTAKRKKRVSKSDRLEGRKKSSGSRKLSSDECDDDEDAETQSEDETASRTSLDNVPSGSHMNAPQSQPLFPSTYEVNSNNNNIPPLQGSTSQGTIHVKDQLISAWFYFLGQDSGPQLPVNNLNTFPVVSNPFIPAQLPTMQLMDPGIPSLQNPSNSMLSPFQFQSNPVVQMPPNSVLPMTLSTPWIPSPLMPLSPSLIQSQVTQVLRPPIYQPVSFPQNVSTRQKEDDDYDT